MGEAWSLRKNLDSFGGSEHRTVKGWTFLSLKDHFIPRARESRRDSMHLAIECGMDFPRLLRQVMTWFIEDFQSRALIGKEKWVTPSDSMPRMGGNYPCLKLTSTLIQHAYTSEISRRHVIPMPIDR